MSNEKQVKSVSEKVELLQSQIDQIEKKVNNLLILKKNLEMKIINLNNSRSKN